MSDTMYAPASSREDTLDTTMTIGALFRKWITAQSIEGYRIFRPDDDTSDTERIRLEGNAFLGEANFYDMGDGPEIAELRITRLTDDESVFFLHFMVDDIVRAQELFGEMREALVELSAHKRVNVLLCCTCGITTTMFATKMGQLSDALGLGYDIHAQSLDAVLRSGEEPDVVMLAPQVSYERPRVAKAFPRAIVFEIPAKVYGSYDAAAGTRLIANALDGHNANTAQTGDPLSLPEDLAWPGRIMVVSSALGSHQQSLEYRIFENGEVILEGRTTKRVFDFRDIEDLLAGVRLKGVEVEGLDAIGIAVPGIVNGESVSLLTQGIRGYDLGGHIRSAYAVPVFLDNDANAAAVGCAVTQRLYHSVTYHRQSFGHEVGGQGTVIDGRLNRGRKNFAGEVDHLMNALRWSTNPADLAWTEDGMYELVSRYVLLAAVEVAPEAIYVDAFPVDDMERLRRELRPFLGYDYVPDLIPAPDFGECMLLGELALCIQRLR